MDRNSDKSSRVVTVYNTDYVDTSGDEAAESLSAQSSVYCANYEKEKGPLINKVSYFGRTEGVEAAEGVL